MGLEEVLQRLDQHNNTYVEEFYNSLLSFSSGEHSSYFDTCGLYVVGSSLTSQQPHDIDITLVGLDFRAIFSYDYYYLEEPTALVEGGRWVLESEYAGPSRAFKIYNNKRYIEDFDNADLPRSHMTLSSFSRAFYEHLYATLSFAGSTPDFGADDINPYFGYNHEDIIFGGSRTKYGLIDFFIHGENLHVSQWKEEQEKNNLPYITLKEWSKLDNRDRPRLINLPFPKFITKNTGLTL